MAELNHGFEYRKRLGADAANVDGNRLPDPALLSIHTGRVAGSH